MLARRVDYAPIYTTLYLYNSGHANLQLELGGKLALLDTVFVNGSRACDAQTYEGFMCRRATTNGRFIDYADIDTMQVYYSADLLRDVGGFNIAVRSTRNGPMRLPLPKSCTI